MTFDYKKNYKKPKIFDFENDLVLKENLQNFVENKLYDIHTQFGIARIALGYSKIIYSAIKEITKNPYFDWNRLEIYQTDEIIVEQKKTYFLRLKNTIKNKVFEEIGEIINFRNDINLDLALDFYQQKLDSLEENYFDLVILEMKENGRIASLFPFGKYLKHQEKSVIKTKSLDFDNENRLSLTIESLLNSKEILLVINDINHKNLLLEMLESNSSATSFPAKFLLAHPNLNIFHTINGINSNQ